jgi:hypothetical protein
LVVIALCTAALSGSVGALGAGVWANTFVLSRNEASAAVERRERGKSFMEIQR